MTVERQFYKEIREESRKNSSSHTSQPPWASIEGTQHISIDAMKQLAIPTFGSSDQPKDTFYHQKLTFTPMGVFAEDTGQSIIYLYDQTSPKTCSNSVVSILDKFIEGQHDGRKNLVVTMDNCAVNKSTTVRIPTILPSSCLLTSFSPPQHYQPISQNSGGRIFCLSGCT